MSSVRHRHIWMYGFPLSWALCCSEVFDSGPLDKALVYERLGVSQGIPSSHLKINQSHPFPFHVVRISLWFSYSFHASRDIAWDIVFIEVQDTYKSLKTIPQSVTCRPVVWYKLICVYRWGNTRLSEVELEEDGGFLVILIHWPLSCQTWMHYLRSLAPTFVQVWSYKKKNQQFHWYLRFRQH